jgi:FdhD protein
LKRFTRPYHPEAGPRGPAGIMPWRIWRLSDGQTGALDGGVVVEDPLEIRLDGQPVAVLMRTPGMEKELAVGFCLGEGLGDDLMDIALVRHCGRAVPDEAAEGDPLDISRNRVDVTLMPSKTHAVDPADTVQLIRSGCGRTEVSALTAGLRPIDAPVTVEVQALEHLPAQITRQQAAYRAAGGIHAGAVFDTNGRALAVCEDIGRHNAVDKAAGYCLLRGISLQDKMLVSTGRASYDMVAKGVRLGVPIIASISSPTSLAVELADALNCTLLGYLRGKTLNVYTHGWRIVGHGMEKGSEHDDQRDSTRSDPE